MIASERRGKRERKSQEGGQKNNRFVPVLIFSRSIARVDEEGSAINTPGGGGWGGVLRYKKRKTGKVVEFIDA